MSPQFPTVYDRNVETLIFLHIGKTAGTSLTAAIAPQFRKRETYSVLTGWYADPRLFKRTRGSLAHYQTLPASVQDQFRFITGHMHFGLHEKLPGPASYVTVLRKPVERVLSHYGHYCRNLTQRTGATATFDDFCKAKPRQVSNWQTRVLCGWDFDSHLPAESLRRAKDNLQAWFRVVGTTERYVETLLLCEHAFGWSELPHLNRNLGEQRSRDSEKWQRIAEMNALDELLYAHVDHLVSAKVQAIGAETVSRVLAERQQRRQRWRGRLNVWMRSLVAGMRELLDRKRI